MLAWRMAHVADIESLWRRPRTRYRNTSFASWALLRACNGLHHQFHGEAVFACIAEHGGPILMDKSLAPALNMNTTAGRGESDG
jgi:hypothetical protein